MIKAFMECAIGLSIAYCAFKLAIAPPLFLAALLHLVVATALLIGCIIFMIYIVKRSQRNSIRSLSE